MTTTDVEPVTINTNASNTHNVSMVTSEHAQVGHVSSFGGGNVDTENQKLTNSEAKRDKTREKSEGTIKSGFQGHQSNVKAIYH